MPNWTSDFRGGLLVSVAIGAMAVADAAWAQTKSFDLPAQPAATGVAAFARQADVQALISAQDASGQRTNAVHGSYTAGQALKLLLAGTPLTAQPTGASTWTIVARGPRPAGVPETRAESTDLSELIVTAQRRAERVQDVPSAITALPESFLRDTGAQHFADIVRAVPALSFTENSTGQAVLAIRGVQTSSAFSNFQSPVALYVDDVPVLDPFLPWQVPALRLFDVDRVEVLEGPQGTLFGAGALSGAVRIINKKPQLSRYDAAGEVTVQDTRGGGLGYLTSAMINLPIVEDKLGVRLVGYYDRLGGWVDNGRRADKNANDAKIYGGRAQVQWAATDDLDVLATVSNEMTQPDESSYVPYGSKGYVGTNQLPNYNNATTTLYNLTANYAFPAATLTSSTSFLRRSAFSQIDFSGTATAVTHLTAPSALRDTFKTGNFVQEVRLASSAEHPFKWLAGGFLQNYNFDLREVIEQPGVRGLGFATDFLEDDRIDAKIVSQAVFGEASYDILPELTLTVGARYAHFSVAASNLRGVRGATAFDGATNAYIRDGAFNKLTPKVSLAYHYSSDVMVYALASEGYRAGQANLTQDSDPITGERIPPTYGPDQLWNYEVGSKAAFLDRRLIVNAAAYYIDWSKIMLQQTTGGGRIFVGNSGTAHIKGVEAQVTARPTSALEVGVSLSYSDGKLVKILPGVSATVGDQLPGSAKFNGYAYGQYAYALSDETDLTVRLDYAYTGREYSALRNYRNPAALRYGDYSSIGAMAGVSSGRYEVQVFVKNLADLKGRVSARTLYPSAQEILQTPRTVGVTLRAHL